MPDQMSDDHEDMLEEEPIEAFCVSCRQKVEMEHPSPVWTRRGAPGTRGECPQCGTVIFRMGRTDAHMRTAKPEKTDIMGKTAPALKKPGKPRFAAYINYSPPDETFASQLAEDLTKIGIPAWFDPEGKERDSPAWASGVHPALLECSHMVVVLSEAALDAEKVQSGWKYFRGNRKPLVVAQVTPCEIPDDLRRQPRFSFEGDYKAAFRELVRALAG